MRYIIDVSPDKEKDFLDVMKVLRRLKVVEGWQRKGKKRKALDPQEKEEREVSSKEMASQYRDLVD